MGEASNTDDWLYNSNNRTPEDTLCRPRHAVIMPQRQKDMPLCMSVRQGRLPGTRIVDMPLV
eukprot:365491-Chlamydomonas_euryale.AAC.2